MDTERVLGHPAYEWGMAALAVAAVALLAVDTRVAWLVEWTIYLVFVVDYTVRLAVADDRRRFVRRNAVDLMAIIPFGAFRLARVARLTRLARAGSLVWRSSATFRGILATNGMGPVLAVAGVVLLGGTLAVWATDPTFETFGDSLWWAIVTSTTVGYGDLTPTVGVSRGVAVLVMVVGVGTIGMLTAAIATYFLRPRAATAVDVAMTVRLSDGREIELDRLQAEHVQVTLRGLGL